VDFLPVGHPADPDIAVHVRGGDSLDRDDTITVRLDRRVYSPVLRQQTSPPPPPIQWWNNRAIRFEFT
jgi:hypothetical protein